MPDNDIENRLKKKKFRRRLYILVFGLIVGVALSYFMTRPKPLPLVRTAVAAKEASLVQTLSVSAEVSPFAIQNVDAVRQTIVRIPVEVGDRVKKGDVLIVLGKKSLEDDLKKARDARIEAENSVAEANDALAAAQAAAASASEAQMSGMLNQITANLQNSLTNSLAQMTGQLRSQFPSSDDFSNMTAEQLKQWQVYLDGLRADVDKWIAQMPQTSPAPSPSPVPTAIPTIAPTVPSAKPTETSPVASPTPVVTEPTVTASEPSTAATTSPTTETPTPSVSPTPEPSVMNPHNAVGGSAGIPMAGAADFSQFLSGSGMAGDALSSTMAQGDALVEQLKEAEAQAQEALDNAKTEIKAEVDGFVVSINAEVGEPVAPNPATTALGTTEAPAMVIYDDSSLVASFRANRYDAVRLEKGQKVHYISDNLSFNGEVIFKSPIATTSAASNDLSALSQMSPLGADPSAMLSGEALVDIRMSLDGEDLDQLIIGFPIDAEIVVSEVKDVLAIPAEALTRETDTYYVYVLDSANVVHKRKVEVGIQADVFAEISDGLDVGEIVVLNPTGTIKEGQEVKRDG